MPLVAQGIETHRVETRSPSRQDAQEHIEKTEALT
jgi:hypothetical protein